MLEINETTPINYGFCDLCINIVDEDKNRLRRVLQNVHSMGYETVAINQNVDESVFETEKRKKKKGSAAEAVACPLPAPLNLKDLVEEFKGKLSILSRITFAFSDPIKTHMLNQATNFKEYDIFAISPKNKNALQYTCSQSSADIISLNPSKSTWKFSRKLYMQALERKIHFEIKYSDVINSSTRQLAIALSHTFFLIGKSKNVIISSGADDVDMIRNPYDIITLARVLGLNEEKAKASILWQCRYLILKAQGRVLGKTFFMIKPGISEGNHSKSEESDNEEENVM